MHDAPGWYVALLQVPELQVPVMHVCGGVSVQDVPSLFWVTIDLANQAWYWGACLHPLLAWENFSGVRCAAGEFPDGFSS